MTHPVPPGPPGPPTETRNGIAWRYDMISGYWVAHIATLPEEQFIPERCKRCEYDNPSWSAESPLWNYVMRGNDIDGDAQFGDMVCIRCFIELAIEAGLPDHGWRLTLDPAPEGLKYETPSGRVWDKEKFLWVEKEQPGYPYVNCTTGTQTVCTHLRCQIMHQYSHEHTWVLVDSVADLTLAYYRCACGVQRSE